MNGGTSVKWSEAINHTGPDLKGKSWEREAGNAKDTWIINLELDFELSLLCLFQFLDLCWGDLLWRCRVVGGGAGGLHRAGSELCAVHTHNLSSGHD